MSRPTRIALLLTTRLGLRALETCSPNGAQSAWTATSLRSASPRRRRAPACAHCRFRPAAVEELRELKAVARKPGGGYVFPAEGGAKRVEHLHPESLSRAFARACARLGIAGASTHDLRRTCLSGLIELGHEGVAGRIAGHRGSGVMAVHYDRSRRLDAMRRALEDWSSAIDDAAERAS